MKQVIATIFLVLLPIIASAGVVINGVEISDSGKIIYLDKSEQGTATAKGDPGAQGPKGDIGPQGPKGDQGQVDKATLCQLYINDGLPAPSICTKKIIFVTSQKFDGNLGGLAGADSKCQTSATTAGLSGTFKAWLSDATTAAKDRLNHNPGAYVRTDGVMLASNWKELISGYLKTTISCDEYNSCTYGVSRWQPDDERLTWTSTYADGDRTDPDNPSSTCADWTTSGFTIGGPHLGMTWKIDVTWTDDSGLVGYPCESLLRLYCVEQ